MPSGEAGQEDNHNRGHDQQDLDLEITALPLTPARQAGRAPWYLRRMELPRPLVAAGVVALVALALLDLLPRGSAPLAALVARPTATATTAAAGRASVSVVVVTTSVVVPVTPTPSPFPTPTLVAPPIAAMPRAPSCTPDPAGSANLGGFERDGAALGAPSVWVDGFDRPVGSGARITLPESEAGSYTQYGWPVGTALVLARPFDAAVTLRGANQRTGAPLWFSFAPDSPDAASPVPVVTLDPQRDFPSSDSHTQFWFGTLYLPGAGCYTLRASWPGGGWQMTFAAGR